MNAAPIACPYCNAAVTVAPGTAAGHRVSCPRCGDAFTLLQRVPGEVEGGIQTAPAVPPVNLDSVALPPRRSNGRVLAMILGLMGCMAAVGLAYALFTQADRRANDAGITQKKARRSPQPEPEEPAPAVVAPDKLEALGYLPADTGILVGAHVADLLSTPAGNQLLREPIHVGRFELNVSDLAGYMGLRPEDLDHLVAGFNTDKGLLALQFMAVARTRQAIDPEQLRGRLNGQRVAGTSKKGIFRYAAPGGKLLLPLAMYCPNNHTVIISLLEGQLEKVPATPVADLGQFREEIRTVLRERREPGCQFWAAGYVENWNKSAVGRALQKLSKEDRERLMQVRTFGAWIQLDTGVTLKGSLHCQDAARARALDEVFHAPEWVKLNLKTAVDGPWISLQMSTDLATIQRALKP